MEGTTTSFHSLKHELLVSDSVLHAVRSRALRSHPQAVVHTYPHVAQELGVFHHGAIQQLFGLRCEKEREAAAVLHQVVV